MRKENHYEKNKISFIRAARCGFVRRCSSEPLESEPFLIETITPNAPETETKAEETAAESETEIAETKPMTIAAMLIPNEDDTRSAIDDAVFDYETSMRILEEKTPKYAAFLKSCVEYPLTVEYVFTDTEDGKEYSAVLNIASEEKAAYSLSSGDRKITDEFVDGNSYYRLIHSEKTTYYANLDVLKSHPIAENAITMITFSAEYAPVLNFDAERAKFEIGVRQKGDNNYQYEKIITAGGRRITAYFEMGSGDISFIETDRKSIRVDSLTHTEKSELYMIRADYETRNGMARFFE